VWWRARARVLVTAARLANGHLSISVDNSGASDLAATQLVVTSPGMSMKPVLAAGLPGLQVAKQDDLRWVVFLPALRAGTSTKFTLKFVK
jgi:hypothetical protein